MDAHCIFIVCYENKMEDMNPLLSEKQNHINRMVDCDPLCLDHGYSDHVKTALEWYLPEEIFDEYKDNLYFIHTGAFDGCRIAPAIRKEKEIIVLAERIFPKKNAKGEENSDVRYFYFVILHEIAHVVKQHRSPGLDSLSSEENKAQENEADKLAIEWFNQCISRNRHLRPITIVEINQQREYKKKLADDFYENG